LVIAAYNAPDLNTVAGTEEEIVELEQRLQEHGVSYQRLRTSHGFHCALVEPAMEPFWKWYRR